jgi:hypothetical protein
VTDKRPIGTPTMTDEQVAAWVAMANDHTLRDYVNSPNWKQALSRKVQRLKASS